MSTSPWITAPGDREHQTGFGDRPRAGGRGPRGGRFAGRQPELGTAGRLSCRFEIERIAVSLERRGDLIALNEHLFESMWTYWSSVASRIAWPAAIARRRWPVGSASRPYSTARSKSFALVGSRPLRRGLAGPGAGSRRRRPSVRSGVPASRPDMVVLGVRRRRTRHSRRPARLCRRQGVEACVDVSLGRRHAGVGNRCHPPRRHQRGSAESRGGGRRGPAHRRRSSSPLGFWPGTRMRRSQSVSAPCRSSMRRAGDGLIGRSRSCGLGRCSPSVASPRSATRSTRPSLSLCRSAGSRSPGGCAPREQSRWRDSATKGGSGGAPRGSRHTDDGSGHLARHVWPRPFPVTARRGLFARVRPCRSFAQGETPMTKS